MPTATDRATFGPNQRHARLPACWSTPGQLNGKVGFAFFMAADSGRRSGYTSSSSRATVSSSAARAVMSDLWWKDFFDTDYLYLWSQILTQKRTSREVDGLWQLLGLEEGARVLDAPCGFGRIARPLAERGARVLGVDQSRALLKQAEQDRDGLSPQQLNYLCHDLRLPLEVEGFDAAVNIYSSLGYGSEQDDVQVLETLRKAVRPGGLVLVETNHRDSLVAELSRPPKPALRLADNTFLVEESRLDPVAGRVQARWFWSGPRGGGMKMASLRIYTATELTRLMETAGLVFLSAHQGCSPEPFNPDGADMGGRMALLAQRP